MITKIRVPARYYDFERACGVSKLAEFQLGLGPCGKVVSALDAGWTGTENNIFWIRQRHVDGTHKIFYYRNADLIGRVEIEE